jgi:hypothetical protein
MIVKILPQRFPFLFKTLVLFVLLVLTSAYNLLATHLRAGQIRVIYESDRTVTVKIEVWTNIEGTSVLFGGDQDILDFGDGSTILVKEKAGDPVGPNGLPLPANVHYATRSYTHTYSAPGIYIVSYREPNRNEGVLNMDGSVSTTFYLETKVIIGDLSVGFNKSPELAIDPIDRACTGVAFFHNPGAHDPDFGDSLYYVMKVPFSDRGREVVNYRDPSDESFYTDYENGNEAKNDEPKFNINQKTGTITWDAPGKAGEYNIAFHIVELRKVNGVWREIGYVRRDMQIIVEDCDNKRPKLELPEDLCVIAGTELKDIVIRGTDEDGDPIKIEAFSPIFNRPFVSGSIFNPPAVVTPDMTQGDTFVPQPAEVKFSWDTECAYVKDQPYYVVFKVTDKPDLGPRLATFETWSIRVVGPKPIWNTATKNDPNRSVNLQWSNYTCANADSMQIWRKVDGSDFQPDTCETGMPPYLGYELVDVVDINTTSYLDDNGGAGLPVGARYCYRLVAVFSPETFAESLVSDDICVDPFPIDVPVITNVDVDVTDPDAGSIIVKWRPPLEKEGYIGHPFRYEVLRGPGLTGPLTDTVVRKSQNYTDTVFVDESLNTEVEKYHYVVNAYSSTGLFIGASAAASSVRAEALSELNEIEITWSAVVPWTNVTSFTHKIYRGPDGSDSKDDLTFIDEVNVESEGFIYEDRGQWDGNPLVQRTVYCYMVETYGSYGNDKIHTGPLINRSQIICAEPADAERPCKPVLALQGYDCDNIDANTDNCAGTNVYQNELTWERDDTECGRDISHYIIYWSNAIDGKYDELVTLPPGQTSYTDILRRSFARCYKIQAVDRSGNKSELSDEFCFDNCPYYELPNVFTPNGDGCNDLYRAYNNIYDNGGETGNSDCVIPDEHLRKCARFVERVVFHVFNRWGREVYTYTGNANDDNFNSDILINWDGRSNDGKDLSTGVYYYVAEVSFLAIRPENKHKTLKGWIHLLRDVKNE